MGTSTISGIKAYKDKLEKLDFKEGSQNKKHCGRPITQLWKIIFTYGLHKEEACVNPFQALCCVERH